MKRLLFLLPLLVLLTGCNEQKAPERTSLSQQNDSAYYHQTKGKVDCQINLALPTEQMNLPVGEWIDESLGGIYPGDQTDMQGLADYYGKYMLDSLCADSTETGEAVGMAFEAKTEKVWETEQFVTYSLTVYADLGGAHPSTHISGATFRKRDGRRLGWEMFSSLKREALSDLIKTELKGYFGVETDEELNDQLTLETTYFIPLPQYPPYLLENGVAFGYQQYEIAAYAAGLPSSVISYKKAKPLMTSWAQRLLK